jgi:hypothetical protein
MQVPQVGDVQPLPAQQVVQPSVQPHHFPEQLTGGQTQTLLVQLPGLGHVPQLSLASDRRRSAVNRSRVRDSDMKACEDACRRCFESCRRMGQGARAESVSTTGLHT